MTTGANITNKSAKYDANGKVKSAKFGTKPITHKKSKSGADYERRVIKRFDKIEHWNSFEKIYNPWIVWENSKNGKICGNEPDILLVNHENKIVVIVEIKSWQWSQGIADVQRTYTPLIQCIYPDYEILGLVVSQKPVAKINNPLKNVTLEMLREKHPQPVVGNTR